MLGASLYLSEEIEKNLTVIDQLSEAGVKTIFTSMHIPEDDPKDVLKALKKITKKVNELSMELMVDISSDIFDIYKVKKEDIALFLKELGIKSLRMDYGFTYQEMKKLSNDFKIVLNASTINDEVSSELKKIGFNLSDITVCHNFYPRENTGLSRKFLAKQNTYLHQMGYKIQAFIVGDAEKRGPIYEGLPTLEGHRYLDPLSAYLDLINNFYVDEVLIGDIKMSEESLQRLALWRNKGILTIPVSQVSSNVPENFYNVHQNRPDVAEDVVRASHSRIELKNVTIEPINNKDRQTGTITIDNKNYGRYAGEIQITKKDLPADERINVLGKIETSAIPLLDFIQEQTKFKFTEV